MKFTAAIFALATVAIAAPTELETRTAHTRDHTSAGDCAATSGKQVCCTGLTCLVQILGNNCKNEAYCCHTGQSVGGLVNIVALNCVKIL
ncbi:hypothetical protein G6O67_005173 [Ophiocordyceps sinensis]|uniref:Hydrophobin 3 n=2 Tax=Ophiocordyceps sinensis TaxID=72228 RepID=A0A8H4PR02_9HYPO|nr:hypothetical protein OCS_04346 [Ophiocordyceps sinensis CO18]KAF4508841.1 hypothetical protein G6O67_005173 [Ophiocordyceps sinensis]